MTEPYNDPYTQMEAKDLNRTDEERARAIVEKREIDLTRAARHALTQDILAALAAVREACATVAESYYTPLPEVCNGIAKAIRTGPSRPSEGEG